MERLFRAVRMRWHDPEIVFSFLGAFVGGVGVLLFLADVFPLNPANFGFFSVLVFLLALYRPNWCFLLLVAVVPFEIIAVSPDSFGLSLRPYQWLFLLLTLALGTRVFSGRTRWPLFAWSGIDLFLALIPIGAFISGFLNGGQGVRLAVIVVSFYALYLLGRVFLRTAGDIRVALATLFASGFAVTIYGIVQNIAFERGNVLRAVMPGRPNATFAEPDWLGFFMVVLLLIVLSRLDKSLRSYAEDPGSTLAQALFSAAALLPIVIALILTVSRSAWLAATGALFVWTVVALYVGGKESLRRVLQVIQSLVIIFVIALVIVVDIPLTRFDLFNRAQSTATGLQEITVACETPTELPEEIASVDRLEAFGCRHIDLEERGELQSAGLSIQTVFRPDPNVEIRGEIYRKTWNEIRSHPVFGIGWGNIGPILGTDENGSAYNASNIWLEIVLGAGLIGFAGLAGALGYVLYRGLLIMLRRTPSETARRLPLVFSLVSAFVIFNLFNAGLLIGLVWLGWAIMPALLAFDREKSAI